jgi:hypothetical protein
VDTKKPGEASRFDGTIKTYESFVSQFHMVQDPTGRYFPVAWVYVARDGVMNALEPHFAEFLPLPFEMIHDGMIFSSWKQSLCIHHCPKEIHPFRSFGHLRRELHGLLHIE